MVRHVHLYIFTSLHILQELFALLDDELLKSLSKLQRVDWSSSFDLKSMQCVHEFICRSQMVNVKHYNKQVSTNTKFPFSPNKIEPSSRIVAAGHVSLI